VKLLLDILQGMGVSAAVGVRPFLPTLLVGALAADDLGVNFDGTDFAFLESPWFLLAIAVALVVTTLLRTRFENPTGEAVLSGIGLGLGALLFAGTLADHRSTWWPGIIGGLLCAFIAQQGTRSLLTRTRARLDAEAAGTLFLYAEAAALVIAGLSVLVPPVSILVIAFFLWLRFGGRRREGEKYAGLRILK
jgi:chromate transport protein ChrA